MKPALALIFLISLTVRGQLTQFVNPFIGTGGHGHTFPGAVMPFGMVQLSPDTRIDGSWDGCSGYHYSDSIIYGFSHTHLSGTGVSDWGDVLLMPMKGAPSADNTIYSSRFSKTSEKASPGYYEVILKNDNIRAELTVTPRVGIHRYTFPETNEAQIILDLLHRDKTLACNVTIKDSCTITGFRISEGWAREQHVYFAIKFSKPFIEYGFSKDKKFSSTIDRSLGLPQGAYFRFRTNKDEQIVVKVGISATDQEGALKNLEKEAPHWSFEKYRNQADSAWNAQLSKVELSGTDKKKKTVFYSALYHCFIHPSLAMDVDGGYRGRDNRVHKAEKFTYYSVFSLWDTYRALHPLLTLLEKRRTADFVNTFLAQYREGGRLPVWELSSNETNCMIGFHAVSVMADAMVKGIAGFNTQLAYEAAKSAAQDTLFGLREFNRKGFLEVDDESESVSKTLEYGYDNYCVGVIAEQLGKKNEAAVFQRQSLAYQNLFDRETGFMRPRSNGNWLSSFSAEEVNNHFTEGNSWQYSFYAPHQVEGLIKLHGGAKNFERKLDELFSTKAGLKGREQPDVTGLIGQYAHGNEPSHHMAYLYNYVGKPQKTVDLVRTIMNDFYSDGPDGLIGNEDCGQMSAWYVFSALGFYPVCPGSVNYIYGEPAFDSLSIKFEAGRTLRLQRSRTSENDQVKGVTFLNRPNNRAFTTHEVLTRGGKIEFLYTTADDTANQYGKAEFNRPRTRMSLQNPVPAPLIISGRQVFRDTVKVAIRSVDERKTKFLFRILIPGKNVPFEPYRSSLVLDSNCRVQAVAVSGKDSSAVVSADFYKLKYKYHLELPSTPNPQYSGSGPNALIDGMNGALDWRKGHWLGFQSKDMEVLVDMGKPKEISYLSLNSLQDTRSWILFPVQVSYFISDDNKTWKLVGSAQNAIKPEHMEVSTQKFTLQLSAEVRGRYLRIVAGNFGSLPDWHAGKGGAAFIFADELEIR